MSGYRDDEEAQRMRVASLEERLAELEAENEALREREAEVDSRLAFGQGSKLPVPPPVSERSKDVEDSLATLQAMGADMARRDAEMTHAPERLSISPATTDAQAPRPVLAVLGPTEDAPIGSLEDLGRNRESEALEAHAAEKEAAYRTGIRDGVLAVVALLALSAAAARLFFFW